MGNFRIWAIAGLLLLLYLLIQAGVMVDCADFGKDACGYIRSLW